MTFTILASDSVTNNTPSNLSGVTHTHTQAPSNTTDQLVHQNTGQLRM